MISILGLVLSLQPAFATGARDYQWTKVEVAELISGIHVTGKMVPQDGALNIESARVSGRILGLLRREGDHVTVGTPLFTISGAECFSLLEEKKVAAGNGMPSLIDSVKKRASQLALSVDEKSCKIVSVHSGVLTKRTVESGASFNAGDPLVTVLDVNRLTGEFDLPERDMAKVKIGQNVRFNLASDPNETYISAITHVVPMIDSTSRTTRIRVKPVKMKSITTQDALIFGEIETGSRESIFRVPSSALVFSRNHQYVVKGPEDRASIIEVKVLGESDSQSSVRPVRNEDLAEGDMVAGSGGLYLFKQLGSGSSL